MFRTIRKVIALSVLGALALVLVSITPDAIGAVIGYAVLGYLLVAAWPRIRRDTGWIRGKMFGPQGSRVRSARGAVGGL